LDLPANRSHLDFHLSSIECEDTHEHLKHEQHYPDITQLSLSIFRSTTVPQPSINVSRSASSSESKITTYNDRLLFDYRQSHTARFKTSEAYSNPARVNPAALRH